MREKERFVGGWMTPDQKMRLLEVAQSAPDATGGTLNGLLRAVADRADLLPALLEGIPANARAGDAQDHDRAAVVV